MSAGRVREDMKRERGILLCLFHLNIQEELLALSPALTATPQSPILLYPFLLLHALLQCESRREKRRDALALNIAPHQNFIELMHVLGAAEAVCGRLPWGVRLRDRDDA
jgi:hypothetical protein